MKKLIIILILLIFLSLDWAALHDIVKGEPDLYGEYGVLAFSSLIFATIIFMRRKIWK